MVSNENDWCYIYKWKWITLNLSGLFKCKYECNVFFSFWTSLDSSSEDDGYEPPFKKQNIQYYNNAEEVKSGKKVNNSGLCERSTVIVSPSKSNADGGYVFNAASSSQDSDSSDDDPIMPTVHKTLIKPKSAAAPVINHKATAMMVSLLMLLYVLLLMNSSKI